MYCSLAPSSLITLNKLRRIISCVVAYKRAFSIALAHIWISFQCRPMNSLYFRKIMLLYKWGVLYKSLLRWTIFLIKSGERGFCASYVINVRKYRYAKALVATAFSIFRAAILSAIFPSLVCDNEHVFNRLDIERECTRFYAHRSMFTMHGEKYEKKSVVLIRRVSSPRSSLSCFTSIVTKLIMILLQFGYMKLLSDAHLLDSWENKKACISPRAPRLIGMQVNAKPTTFLVGQVI